MSQTFALIHGLVFNASTKERKKELDRKKKAKARKKEERASKTSTRELQQHDSSSSEDSLYEKVKRIRKNETAESERSEREKRVKERIQRDTENEGTPNVVVTGVNPTSDGEFDGASNECQEEESSCQPVPAARVTRIPLAALNRNTRDVRLAQAEKEVGVEDQVDQDDAAFQKKAKQLLEQRRRDANAIIRQQDKCNLCPGTTAFKRREANMISVSTHAFLMALPPRASAVEYHLVIAPMMHAPSILVVEDDTYEEMRNYMKSLVAFLETKDMLPLFLESAYYIPSKEMQLLGGGPHTSVEVIPIPAEQMEEAIAYYRKAFEESGVEWASHKKVLDTRGRRGAPRGCIPPTFPYVHVDFSLQGGFAQVVEGSKKSFPAHFLRDVALGIREINPLDRPFPDHWSFDAYVKRLREEFQRFDWVAYQRSAKNE